jgi:SAM-dependent methyltransferase
MHAPLIDTPALGRKPEFSFALEALTAACHRLSALAEDARLDCAAAYHRAVSLVHTICDALVVCEAAGMDPADLRQIVEPARRVHATSPFIRRMQEWPRGYAGDFETIEWLCRGQNRAESLVGRAFEQYALTAAIAQQHRNKIAFQAACVLDAIERRPDCRVLSIACGSSPDIRSIARFVGPEATFVLSDSDPEALAYSARHLGPLAERCTFVQGAVPGVLRRLRPLGPFDLVYAGGLFDYLPSRVIERSLAMIWSSLLAGGGRVVFTNIAQGNPFRVWLDYIANWPLIERSERDVESLIQAAGIEADVELTRDATGLAILASLRRSDP